jgi:galactose-1-phosphate uridylyltransferase
MFIKKVLLIGLSFFLINQLTAQVEPAQIIKTFFQKYKQTNSDEAIDYFFSLNPSSEDMEEGIDNVKRTLVNKKMR